MPRLCDMGCNTSYRPTLYRSCSQATFCFFCHGLRSETDENECPIEDMVKTAKNYAMMGHNIKQIASQLVTKYEEEYRFQACDMEVVSEDGETKVISVPYRWTRGNSHVDSPLWLQQSVITHLYNDPRFEMLRNKEVVGVYDSCIEIFNDTLVNDSMKMDPDNAALFMKWAESREKVITSMTKRDGGRYAPYREKHV